MRLTRRGQWLVDMLGICLVWFLFFGILGLVYMLRTG